MHIRSDQVIQFVQNTVNDFNQEMALLVLQGGRHEQRQDLVEQRTCSKFTSLIRDLTQRSLGEGEGGLEDGVCLLQSTAVSSHTFTGSSSSS